MLQSEPGPAAHFPVSALATRWGLGGALGFVPLKASRMGGTTTGNIMPVDADAKVEKSSSVWEKLEGRCEGLEDDDKRVTICVFGQSGRRAAAVTRAASSARDEQPQSWIGWSEEKNPSVCATSLNGVSLEGRGNGFGGFSPVKPMKQLHITTGSRCMAT